MQFRRVEAYSETRMAESLRQAYDYWQDQLRSTKLHLHRIVSSSST